MKLMYLFGSLFLISNLSYANTKTHPEKVEKQSFVKKETISLLKKSPFKNALSKALKEQPSFSREALIKAFSFLDQNHKELKKEDLCFAKTNTKNKEKIRNLNCMIIADYSKQKTTPRLLYINPKTGDNEIFLTAHGKGSNKPAERETGLETVRYSNVSGSNMTSLGFYLTDFLITSKKKTFGPGPNNGLMLDGISCTNSNARMRQIVAHTAMYVPSRDEKESNPKVGNSEGCITIPAYRKEVLKSCEHGALVYAYDNMNKHLTNYKK